MEGDSQQVDQDEIEALLKMAQGGDLPPKPTAAASAPSEMLEQDEIEALINRAPVRVEAAQATQQTRPETMTGGYQGGGLGYQGASGAGRGPGGVSSDVELLLRKAEEAIASIEDPSGPLPEGVRPFSLEDFSGSPASTEAATLELVRDVELDLKIELGRTQMHLEEVLRLKRGSVVALDKLAGDPVDVIVNGRLIARGEVLVLNDNFCVRVTELVVGEASAA